MNIRGIVFDKDGTLFDFQATWAAWCRGVLDAESRGDAALAARMADALGFDLAAGLFRPDSMVIGHTSGEVAAELLHFLPGEDHATLLARLDAHAAQAPQQPMPGLAGVLGTLRARGLRLGVATNDSEAPARAHLREAGVEADFDFIAGFDSGHGGKPGPGQLLAFADATGLDPAACAMVGDSLHDLRAGRAAGMLTIGVLSGLAAREVLAPMADAVLGSIADLPGWFASRG
ncbi:MAG: HAD family hydrolase [Rubellimicrobium sp.]|nr:HAD family hydrolase [Rubellimicrobium sp.]